MSTPNWKRIALGLGLLFATQACAVFIDDDDDYRHHRHYRYQRWQRHSSLSQQQAQTVGHLLLAEKMVEQQESP